MTLKQIRQQVNTALKETGASFYYQVATEEKFPYLTYFVVSDQDVAYGDGDPLGSSATIQVDVWHTGDLDDLSDITKKAMAKNGFRYQFGRDFYEKDREIFHRVLQFSYYQEGE